MKAIESYSKKDDLQEWAKNNKTIFQPPTSKEEAIIVRQIYEIPHFQQGLENKKRLQGGAFADPWLIAKAKEIRGILVTEEKFKSNGAKIPNICKHFDVDYINLELFMEKEHWSF